MQSRTWHAFVALQRAVCGAYNIDCRSPSLPALSRMRSVPKLQDSDRMEGNYLFISNVYGARPVTAGSDGDLGADLDHAARRNLEEVGGIAR
jgi:hypothetical protein